MRPRAERLIVALAIVVDGDDLERAVVRRSEQFGHHHRRVVTREHVAIREGTHVVLLAIRHEVHVHAPVRLHQLVELLHEARVLRQVLHHAEYDDRIELLGRLEGENALVDGPGLPR